MIARWKGWARRLQAQLIALYYAYRDPRVSWPARIFAALVVGYAFSPIDLIPDPIPILGYLDDLVLIPAGVWLALRMIPPEVLADSRARAQARLDDPRPVNRVAGVIIGAVWIALLVGAILLLRRAAR